MSGNWEEKFFGNLASDEPKFGRAKRLRVFSDKKQTGRLVGRPLNRIRGLTTRHYKVTVESRGVA